METCDWRPFIKAAVERNPVSLAMVADKTIDEVYTWLKATNNDSIYDSKRLAQPDELVNYKTGDGLEKVILLANVIRQRNPAQNIEIVTDKSGAVLKGQDKYTFATTKGLQKQVFISADGNITTKD
jgi:hypothetical protein